MRSLNEMSYEIVRAMAAQAEILDISVDTLAGGATRIDAGVHVNGSLEAGRLFSEACLGGLGKVEFCVLDYDGTSIPGVRVTVSHPAAACMASQYAGWAVKVKGPGKKPYQAMGSGPARLLYGKEPLFEGLGITEQGDRAVLALESHTLPNDEIAAWIAQKCGVSPGKVSLLVAPTASLVGSVQVAARVVEAGLHKMMEVGFDIKGIVSGLGVCPMAPVARDDLRAIGRTNDAVLFGGKAWYTAKSDPDKINEVIDKLPSSASADYGTPFYELFRRYDHDFYKIDPLLFSPAEVSIHDMTSGRTFHAGRANAALLKKGLFS